MTDPVPLMSSLHAVEADWIDYNQHMNMGYYTVLFDRTADEAYAEIGFGPDYRAASGCTTYAAEFHVRYLRELKLGDRVRASFRILDHDEKRFHSYQELMREDGTLVATGEGIALHVDQSGPKVVPMPDKVLSRLRRVAEAHKALPRPETAGRGMGLRRGAV
ncbi:thioesterase [Roseovarius atlanticus]|uniref:Thioesterase n=1 Tax=Roseovarius atlanticus TaxID=1641875 RepID=A0A0T5NV60_9RHOB|nr:thioesterase family protein [Roseovarius atlanticus]KRS12827.1 thioesterase [Roseovarius atlanticus]